VPVGGGNACASEWCGQSPGVDAYHGQITG
jgi:hypothetical protein